MSGPKEAPAPGPSDRPTLDPVDGQPTFIEHEGVWISRVRWLEATRSDRKAALVDQLRQPDENVDA